MKKTYNFLTTIFFLIVCCTSCSMPDPKKMEEGSEKFARDSVQEIGQNWQAEAFTSRVDPSLAAALGDPSPLFKMFAIKLGPIVKINKVTQGNVQTLSGLIINRPDYSAQFKCDVDCKSGPATVLLSVIHKDNKWSLTGINVDSKLLEDFNKADMAESKKFVEKIAPGICANLNINYLKGNADKKLLAELKNPVTNAASNAMFASVSKMLGKYKKCEETSQGNATLIDGKFIYRYSVNAVFEHGTADLSFVAVKEGKDWKLSGFNILGHRRVG